MRIGPSELILVILLPIVVTALVIWLVIRSVSKKQEKTVRKQDTGITLSTHQQPSQNSEEIEGQPRDGMDVPNALVASRTANSDETSNNIATCAMHPSFAAVGSCHVCGTNCCASCARYIGRDVYCVLHYDEAQQEVQNETQNSEDVIRIWPGKKFLAIAAGLVIWGLFSSMGGIESFIGLLLGAGVGYMIYRTGKKTPTTSTEPGTKSSSVRVSVAERKKEIKGGGSMIAGILVGFVAMAFLSVIPVLGPLLAGFVAGVIVGGGAGKGSLTGFLAGIFGAILLAILVTGGFAWFGSLLDMPILGTVLGGSVGVIIVIAGLYEGFLGLVGGAIGGLVRKKG